MSVDIVTDKYSTAIFELAQEQQILEQMETDLSYVKEVMDTQSELGTLLLYPALDAEAKCNVLAKYSVKPLIRWHLTPYLLWSNADAYGIFSLPLLSLLTKHGKHVAFSPPLLQ